MGVAGAWVAGAEYGRPYSSSEGIRPIYPVMGICVLIVIALLVRRALKKDRIAKTLHYTTDEHVMSIEKLSDNIGSHTHGIIKKIHTTNPIKFDVEFSDESGKVIGIEKVEATQIIAVHDTPVV